MSTAGEPVGSLCQTTCCESEEMLQVRLCNRMTLLSGRTRRSAALPRFLIDTALEVRRSKAHSSMAQPR